jgi:hypothetical protein
MQVKLVIGFWFQFLKSSESKNLGSRFSNIFRIKELSVLSFVERSAQWNTVWTEWTVIIIESVKVLSSVVQLFDFVNNLWFQFSKSKNLLWFWVFENFQKQKTFGSGF